MRFIWFNLMPWPHLPEDFREKYRSVWVDIPSSLYDPVRGHEVYNDYLDQLEFAETVEIVVVDLVPAHRIVQRAGDVDPDRPIFLAEIIGQVGPGHQVEPDEAHPTLPVQDRIAIIHWRSCLRKREPGPSCWVGLRRLTAASEIEATFLLLIREGGLRSP